MLSGRPWDLPQTCGDRFDRPLRFLGVPHLDAQESGEELVQADFHQLTLAEIRVPLFLGMDGRLLAQGGVGDLAASIFNGLAPGGFRTGAWYPSMRRFRKVHSIRPVQIHPGSRPALVGYR
jgi:hypothetical protein